TNQQIQISVTNIYVGGFPLDIAGTASLNSEFPNIQFNDDTVSLILSLLPGGNYSNGIGTVNCPISTSFDLSFEFKDQDNQKWRLPSYVIADNSIGTNICKSTITGGAVDTNSWVFGSAFITNFYIVFDQAKSQLGIATRKDINYGDIMRSNINVQLPVLSGVKVQCLKIYEVIGDKINYFKVYSVDKNPGDFYYLGDDYFATEYYGYAFQFYSDRISDDGTYCQGNLVIDTYIYQANVIYNPWQFSLSYYTVSIKVKPPNSATCVALRSIYEDNLYATRFDVPIDFSALDPDGYYVLPDPIWAYTGAVHHFVAFKGYYNSDGDKGCYQDIVGYTSTLATDITNDEWAIEFN
ncbi:20293_t:CDS:2, partial [Gigaspora rosea]